MKKHNVIVVGGGPAGMMAALTAATEKKKVILIEKNPQLGRKLAITGGGRCNITNLSEPDEMIKKTINNGKFLYSAFNTLKSKDLMKQIEDMGIPLKVEAENKVFPVSDRSTDIIEGFYKRLRDLGVEFIFNKKIIEILMDNNSAIGVRLEDKSIIEGRSIILATGGVSYPFTGSTGEGYSFSRKLGHSIVEPKPGLVPVVVGESWIKELMGISLGEAEISFKGDKKKPIKVSGPLIFTHYGLSGPAILELSSHLNEFINKEKITLKLDLLPRLSEEYLENVFIKPDVTISSMSLKKFLNQYLPKNLLQVLLGVISVDGEISLKQITKNDRLKLLKIIKNMELTAVALRGLKEAIITSGGVAVKEINPKTMESKLLRGLFFAGEIIDADAVTGGYNLHIAFSTGYLAGFNA